VVFLFPVIKKLYLRIGLLGLFTTSTICVIYSGSRTAYIAIVAFIVYWYFISKRKSQFITIGLIVGSLVIFILPEQYIGRFKSITGEEAEGHSRDTRIVILEDAMQILMENPAGVGVGSFPAVRMERFGRKQDTHNLYFEVATNLGIQGLIIFLIFVGIMLRSFWRSRSSYLRQLQAIKILLRQPNLTPGVRKVALGHHRDLHFLVALCQAGAGFIYLRLVLGLLGMDLYEVYWWFGVGLAICLTNLLTHCSNKTRFLIEFGKPTSNAA